MATKTFLLASLSILVSGLAFAAAAEPFELHAVADAASNDTTEYSLPSPKGGSSTVLLHSEVLLDSSAIKSAALGHEPEGAPQILITFTESGGKRFAEITTKYNGMRLGIVLGSKLHSTPFVHGPISGGFVTISGNFTEAEATELVQELNQAVAK